MDNTLQGNNFSSSGGTGFLLSPMARKLSRVTERDDTAVTYHGVRMKFFFFMAMILIGAGFAISLQFLPLDGITDDNGIFISYIEIVLLLISLVLIIVCPLLAFFIRVTVPVTGTLGCLGNGYLLAFIGRFIPEYRGAMLLAFVLTFAIVFTMQALYFSGKVKVTKKFRLVVTTLFCTMIFGGVLVGICCFIPGCRDLLTFIQGNAAISVGFSILGIVIATLFLLVDFDTIRRAVEDRLPAKYEWFAAYALAFTVIWLYFKVLDLITMKK